MLLTTILSLLLAASAVAGDDTLGFEARGLEFTPQHGFSGFSEGNGSLKLVFGKSRTFHVESHGYDQDDGAFRIDQTVTFQGQSPRDRVWRLRSTILNHYRATLSDAAGQVTGRTEGARLLLRYRVKGPLVMNQTLELMLGGKIIDNVGIITLFGIPVGYLHETITRRSPRITSHDSFKRPASDSR